MGAAPGASKLFHAIVVVGLSFASSACGSAESPVDPSAGGDSGAEVAVDGGNGENVPDAASDAVVSIDEASVDTIIERLSCDSIHTLVLPGFARAGVDVSAARQWVESGAA
jgi:hypothetical protein